MSEPATLERCLEYIKRDLRACIRSEPVDRDTLLGLPHPYVIPNPDRFQEMFYWDSYFTILGLMELGWVELSRGMVENCLFLIERFGHMPNASRTYYLTRSQPPFLTSMIAEVYARTRDKAWLERAFRIAQREYQGYWNAPPHLVPEAGLSRYADKGGNHEDAENESGWDLTPRFLQRGNDFCPIDLNCYLYKYERDFAGFSMELDDARGSESWCHKAEARRRHVDRLMWDAGLGLFFDHDFVHGQRSPVKSLASYVTLWSGLATPAQAEAQVRNLDLFEKSGGLVTCDHDYGAPERQWNYPNGWPPVQWMVIRGLKDYGFAGRAAPIRDKWLGLCLELFERTGVLWEKYDVVNRDVGTDDLRYPTQQGFSWTNAVFLALHNLEL